MNEQSERIEKMLRAQLKGAGHLWWIGGYVYGVTSNGDLFIILYPAAENLREKVVRVYEHDFRKLPAFIRTEGIDGGDTEANPSKEQARKKGIYHECPAAFEIVTYDGKDTQMGKERRFGDVLRVSHKAAGSEGATRPASPPPPPPDESDGEPGTVSTRKQPPLIDQGVLPDYRQMALRAKTATEFDYAAYMTLRNGMYTEVERVAKVRESVVMGWKPGERANAAMLDALAVYCEKRAAADGRGAAQREAHQFAQREARAVYNEAIK